MSTHPEAGGQPQVERALQWSAQFEPEEQAPPDLVSRALCRPRRAAGAPRHLLVPVAAVSAISAVAGLVVVAAGPLGRPAGSVKPLTPAGRSVVTPLGPTAIGAAQDPPGVTVALAQAMPTPGGRSPGATKTHAAPGARTAAEGRTHPRAQSRHRGARSEARVRPERRPPPARWRTRLVQEYRSGVLAPALLTQSTGDGAVDVAPAVVDITLDEGLARPANAGPTVRPASYSEGSP